MSDSSGQLDRRQNLSQNQVESLIKAMESVDRRSPSQTNSEPLDAHDPIGSRAEPPEIDADLLSAVRWLHQSMARELKETLATILRTPVEVNVADVSTIFLDSFEEQAKDHRWRSVLSPEVSGGDWYFDVAPELCCVMVDRMLGGDPTAGETFTRPMTEIECRLMGRVVDGMLDIFQRAWQQVTEIRWLIRHQQTRPTVNTIQREAMVQIRFGIALCSNQENIRLCIPVRAIEDLRELLCDHSQRLDSSSVLRPRQRMASNVAGAPIDVVATVARSTIRTGDLLDLNVGDIIATEKGVDEPLELTIQNVPKFKIRAGALKGNKAIQIEATLDPPEIDDQASQQSSVPSKESGE